MLASRPPGQQRGKRPRTSQFRDDALNRSRHELGPADPADAWGHRSGIDACSGQRPGLTHLGPADPSHPGPGACRHRAELTRETSRRNDACATANVSSPTRSPATPLRHAARPNFYALGRHLFYAQGDLRGRAGSFSARGAQAEGAERPERGRTRAKRALGGEALTTRVVPGIPREASLSALPLDGARNCGDAKEVAELPSGNIRPLRGPHGREDTDPVRRVKCPRENLRPGPHMLVRAGSASPARSAGSPAGRTVRPLGSAAGTPPRR